MRLGRVSSFCFASDTRRVTLVTNPMISLERTINRILITTNGTYLWSLVRYFITVKQIMVATVKLST